MDVYESHMAECLSFINVNKSLIDCHLVDFITENLWEKCLTSRLKLQLEQLQTKNCDIAQLLHNNNNNEFHKFIQQVNTLNLKNSKSVMEINEISSLIPHIDFEYENQVKNTNEFRDEFMKDKKLHEINVLTKVIGYLTTANSNLVIDVGAGKGYLATSLSQNYGIPVLAIDSCESRHKSAINRQELMKKKKKQSFPLVKYFVKFIDDTTDYSQLVRSLFHNYNDNDNFILVGLHTCGPLAHAMIKSFLRSSCLNILCMISCCYHLTDESLTGQCHLTKNARMLAQQSVDRISTKNKFQSSSSLFYRAVLQVLLKSLGMDNVRIGRGAPMNNFSTYAKWSLTKIGIELEKIPSEQQLTELYDKYINQQWRMNLFQLLRIYAGSVVEAAIILDRAIYLCKSQKCTKVALVKLFDPLLSPRCYAIIAIK